jgi:hypothetical protein
MDTNPPESGKPIGDIAAELQELSRNLREALRSAWESEERRKFQEEIETGLNNLGTSLNRAIQDFSESPTGQTLKADINDINERIKTGEMEAKLRNELLGALRTVNQELQKVLKKDQSD